MVHKDLVLSLSSPCWVLPLEKDSNFIKEYSVPGGSFEVRVRTYFEYSYFTIKTQDQYLCLNNIAKLRVNLSYAPVLTLEGHQHVFFLDSTKPTITTPHYSLFGDVINLYYMTEPYYDAYFIAD